MLCSLAMVTKMGIKMALLKVTEAGTGKLQILCSNHVVTSVRGGVYSADSAWELCAVNSKSCLVLCFWSCWKVEGREEPLSYGGLTFWPVFASAFLQPHDSNSWTQTLLCLLVDINYAASPFRQGLCLPACLSGISGAPVLIGAPSINNNHCQSRLFRAEQSEVIWLWKAPQSMTARCDPEMLARKSITWWGLCGQLVALPCADSTWCHGDGTYCVKCMCSLPKGSRLQPWERWLKEPICVEGGDEKRVFGASRVRLYEQ